MTQARWVTPASDQALAGKLDVADPSLDSYWPSLPVASVELLSISARHPWLLARIQARLAIRLVRITLGGAPMPIPPDDRRFSHAAWQENPAFSRVLQTYLAWHEAMGALIDSLPVDEETRRRFVFLVEHLLAALAPSNFGLTHPGFYEQLWASQGKSLLTGLGHLASDVRHNHGLPSQVDTAAFRIGQNLATATGAVIFRNAQFELIQYAPRQAAHDPCPILFVPPQINKYYVLDLSPDNSLVQAALAAGQSVFMISWRNPTAAQRDWGLDVYVAAVNDAIDIVWAVAGERPIKLVGACAGGLTASVALAQRAAEGRADRVGCLSLLVTLLAMPRHSDAGHGGGDHRAIRQALARSSKTGVLDGADMARAFAWLRPNDLVWRFVTHNYVLGQRPPANDILYWNNDTTRLPARLHADLLRIYAEDALARPDGMTIDATPIDLSAVTCDVFVVAGQRDHITPWSACHRAAARLGGQVRFVLVEAGHVQSLVCPLSSTGGYWRDVASADESPADWQDHADRRDDSWWPEWLAWCRAHGQTPIAPPGHYGNIRYEPIEAAPGRYVRQH